MISHKTHRVAVNAYLIFRNRFLLLERNTEPFLWGPPGGRLKHNEDPKEGLKREIFEETGIDAQIHMPVTTWFGFMHGDNLLSIDYLCTCSFNEISLSSEHKQYIWQDIDELKMNKKIYLKTELGFQINDFEQAWQIYKIFSRDVF